MKDLYWRGGCCPLQIIYRMEYNKTKAKGYTLPYDTPHQLHMKKVKEITSNVSPGLICRRSTICCWLLFLTVCFPVSYSWSTKRFTRRAKLRSTWTQTLIRSVPPRRLIGTSPTWASSLELILNDLPENEQKHVNVFTLVILFTFISSTTRRSTKPLRPSGTGRRTDQIFSMLLRTPCSRVMWVFYLSFISDTHLLFLYHKVKKNPFVMFLSHTRTVFQVEYKYDKEMLKGCVIPVTDDKLMLLRLQNSEMASEVSLTLVFKPQHKTCTKITLFIHSEVSWCKVVLWFAFPKQLCALLSTRWNTNWSMKRPRVTICLSWTLLKSFMPSLWNCCHQR